MQHGRKNVKIWSDNCGGQNRNKYLLAMHMELIKSLPFDSIEHNYLETGHTQMNVDSMHSAIERAAKHISIYTPNEWCNVIRKARAENKKTKTTPYKVIRMQHNDFIDLKDAYSHLMNRSTTDTDNEKIACGKSNVFALRKIQLARSNSNIRMMTMIGRCFVAQLI